MRGTGGHSGEGRVGVSVRARGSIPLSCPVVFRGGGGWVVDGGFVEERRASVTVMIRVIFGVGVRITSEGHR